MQIPLILNKTILNKKIENERKKIMKHMKRLFGILLTLFMLVAIATPALAAQGSGTITVKNATIGKAYAAYKIFDATYSGTAPDQKVSYTIESTSQWYSAVENSNLFDLTEVSPTGSGIYNVVPADEVTDAQILTWMKGLDTTGKTADFSDTASSTTVEWTNVDYGYYFITSGLGAAVTVTSNLPDATILDKNQAPGFNPEDPENPDGSGNSGKFVKDGDEWGKSNTASIGDTVHFKINAFTPAYSGSAMVVDYTFTDTLAKGLSFNDDLTVTVTGNNYVTTLNLTAGTDYTLTTTENEDGTTTITVVVNVLSIEDYPTDAHVSIAYTANVNEDAAFTNLNSVTMDWRVTNPNNPWDPADPENPDKGTPKDPEDYVPEDPNFPNPMPPTDPSKTTTYVYGFDLQKYANDVGDDNKLEGARFKLYDAATGGNEIPVVLIDTVYDTEDPTVVVERHYRVAVEGETGVEIEAGTAKIFGLKAGNYYLEETFAPYGFNMLTAREEVTVSDLRSTEAYTGAADVVNLSGTVLPTTGGIGTTIFYLLGGALVLGAVVLLVVKKRMVR